MASGQGIPQGVTRAHHSTATQGTPGRHATRAFSFLSRKVTFMAQATPGLAAMSVMTANTGTASPCQFPAVINGKKRPNTPLTACAEKESRIRSGPCISDELRSASYIAYLAPMSSDLRQYFPLGQGIIAMYKPWNLG